MATTTFHEYDGDGSDKTFDYSFPTYSVSEVVVEVNGVLVNNYTIDPYNTSGTNTVTFDNTTGTTNTDVCESDGSPKTGVKNVRIRRDTNVDTAKATYSAGSAIKANDLNDNQTQILRALQEEQSTTINTTQIRDSAITTAKIKADNITSALIADDQINSEHYVAGSIDLEHMSANSVDSDQYVDGSIDSAHIANDQINSQHYAAGSIDLEHMSANSVDSDQYVDGSVDLIHLAANSVDSSKIVDGSIVNADINTAAEIAVSKLADGSARQVLQTAANGSDVEWTSNVDIPGTLDVTGAATLDSTLNITGTTHAAAINASAAVNVTGNLAINTNKFNVNATSGDTTIAGNIAVSGTVDGRDIATDGSKLDGIEASADVTDATNVNAAGAVMNSDLGTKGQIIVGGATPTILPVGTNNHVLVADSNEASGVKWATTPAGSGLSNVIEDTTPQLGGDLDVNGNDIVSTSNGNINITPNGSGDVIIDGLKYPQADGSANQFLKTNGSAQLSWADVDLSAKFTKAGDSITGDSTIVSGVTNKNIHIDINNADTLIRFDDDLKATFGDADDLQVYWNGTQGHIIAPSGRVDITADDFMLVSHDSSGRAIYLNNSGGHLELGFDGNHDAYFNGGSITLFSDTTLNAQKDLRFADADSSNYVAFQAPATIGSNVTWTLPAADGSANQVLKTAGDGTLSWTTVSGTITALNNQTANRLTTIGSTTTELDGEANLTFDGSTLAVTGNQTVSTTLAATGQITGQGFECPATVTANWSIGAANNAFFPGPMTVDSGVTVTVPANRTLTVV